VQIIVLLRSTLLRLIRQYRLTRRLRIAALIRVPLLYLRCRRRLWRITNLLHGHLLRIALHWSLGLVHRPALQHLTSLLRISALRRCALMTIHRHPLRIPLRRRYLSRSRLPLVCRRSRMIHRSQVPLLLRLSILPLLCRNIPLLRSMITLHQIPFRTPAADMLVRPLHDTQPLSLELQYKPNILFDK